MKAWKNKYTNYSLEDFLLDETFIDWVYHGKAKDHLWFFRLAANAELQEDAEKAESILLKLHSAGFETDHTRIEGLKDKIDAKIEAFRIQDEFGRHNTGRHQVYNRIKYTGVAASIAVLVATILVILMPSEDRSSTNESNTEVRRHTRYGQKLTVHLSDGSKVKLNSGSSIEYGKYFSDSARIIHLDGEAFFEVAKDSLRPFLVYAGNTVTQAIGTSFNINAESDLSTHISLVTGKVLVKNVMNIQDQRYLTPGKSISIEKKGRLGKVRSFSDEEIAWKDDILVFRNASKTEVFQTLEKWYGVSFELDQDLDDSWSYTGKFNNQSLQNVLMSIGYAEAFTFRIQNKEVVIKPMENQ